MGAVSQPPLVLADLVSPGVGRGLLGEPGACGRYSGSCHPPHAQRERPCRFADSKSAAPRARVPQGQLASVCGVKAVLFQRPGWNRAWTSLEILFKIISKKICSREAGHTQLILSTHWFTAQSWARLKPRTQNSSRFPRGAGA